MGDSIRVDTGGGSISMSNSALGKDIRLTINELPTSSDHEKPGIKETLEQLTEAIENEPSLEEKDREKALKQVEELAKAAQNSNEGEVQKKADNAIRC